MQAYEIILASQSPRRKELLEKHGINFRVFVTDADETVTDPLLPHELVEELSRRKAESAAAQFLGQQVLIIAADTVVALDNEIYGKPKDEADARRMLQNLSGRSHSVFTGVTLGIVQKQSVRYRTFFCETKVYFKPLTPTEMEEYLATGEPYDKAGGYAIQGLASLFVEKISGDYDNVVGLPVTAVLSCLKEENIIG